MPSRIGLTFDALRGILESVLFSHPGPNRTFPNCLSHNDPTSGCPNKFRSRVRGCGSNSVIANLRLCIRFRNSFVNSVVRCAFTLSTSLLHVVKNDVVSPRSTCFVNFFHVEQRVFALFQPFCHPRTQIGIDLACDARRSFLNSVLFSIQVPAELSICLSHRRPASACPNKFRSRGTTGSSMSDKDFGHSCCGRRIHISGHFDIRVLSYLGASSVFPECMLMRRQPLVHSSGSLAMTSITCAAVNCD